MAHRMGEWRMHTMNGTGRAARACRRRGVERTAANLSGMTQSVPSTAPFMSITSRRATTPRSMTVKSMVGITSRVS